MTTATTAAKLIHAKVEGYVSDSWVTTAERELNGKIYSCHKSVDAAKQALDRLKRVSPLANAIVVAYFADGSWSTV